MKRLFLLFLSAIMMLTPFLNSCGGAEEQSSKIPEESASADKSIAESTAESSEDVSEQAPAEPPESIKILFIGNSFSADTAEHTVDILKALGVNDVRVSYLYQGGCSINKHYTQLINDSAAYEYYANAGSGWTLVKNQKISTVVSKYSWDYIVIQHGTLDGSKYADEKSYKNLAKLVSGVKEKAKGAPKIVFNMTWVGEPNSHAEMIAYGNDGEKYFADICKLTEQTVAKTSGIDIVSPTGTAVQNARSAYDKLITRDGYHLSMGFGRYVAGLMLVKTLTRLDIDNIVWAPDGVTEKEKQIAIDAVNAAYKNNYTVTDIS